MKELDNLRIEAEKYRAIYNLGGCDRTTAKNHIMPYIEELNKKSKEIAKKYNRKPKLIGFSSYVR